MAWSDAGLDLADATLPLRLAYLSDTSKLVTFGVDSAGKLTITPITSVRIAGAFSASGAATFDSTVAAAGIISSTNGGSAVRLYGGGSNQWDIYGNSTHLRFGDNTGGGSVWVETDLGVGAAANSWGGVLTGLNVGSSASGFAGGTDRSVHMVENSYFNGSNWIYATTNAAANYYQSGGGHYWRSAGSGTAGTSITWTTAMFLNASGMAIPATNKFYLDWNGSFGDTYITEVSANTIRCIAGGSGGVDLTSGATSWSAVSDETVKVLGDPITDALDKIGTLRTVFGRYKDEDEGVRRPFLVAQDVQAVFPEAVSTADDGILRLSYTDTIPLLVAGIKELRARVAQLEAA